MPGGKPFDCAAGSSRYHALALVPARSCCPRSVYIRRRSRSVALRLAGPVPPPNRLWASPTRRWARSCHRARRCVGNVAPHAHSPDRWSVSRPARQGRLAGGRYKRMRTSSGPARPRSLVCTQAPDSNARRGVGLLLPRTRASSMQTAPLKAFAVPQGSIRHRRVRSQHLGEQPADPRSGSGWACSVARSRRRRSLQRRALVPVGAEPVSPHAFTITHRIDRRHLPPSHSIPSDTCARTRALQAVMRVSTL